MNQSDKRTEIIKEIMKYKEYQEGIALQDLYRPIESHPQYEIAFGNANKTNPKQYQHSTRALLQHRAPLSSQYQHKSEDFLNLGNKSGRWTYFDNPNFSELVKTSKELSKKLEGIEKLKLNTEEKNSSS